jgi:hypothetical protein
LLLLSVSAPLTGDALHVKNIWAAISADAYAKIAEPDCDNRVPLLTSALLNFCRIFGFVKESLTLLYISNSKGTGCRIIRLRRTDMTFSNSIWTHPYIFLKINQISLLRVPLLHFPNEL